MGDKCFKCGKSYHNASYDFHHVGGKDYNMNSLLSNASRKRIIAELNKCVLLCSVCHRLEHLDSNIININTIKSSNTILYRRSLVQIKKLCCCCDCGKVFPPCAMDFDHRNPKSKRFVISKKILKKIKLSILIAEIKKCDVVCSNCHRVRTFKRNNQP